LNTIDRISRPELYCRMAQLMARRSTCGRKQVGAIITVEGRIVSSGYGGVPSGMPHCGPHCDLSKPCELTIHAEQNAIVWAARKGISIEGGTLCCTLSPCLSCAKLIINSGITGVYYIEQYRDTSPISLLRSQNIAIVQYHL